MNDWLQSFGLWVINLLARRGRYRREEHRFGKGERESVDYYRVADAETTCIFLYGGNWRSGRRQDYRFVADSLSSLGVNVAIPDFPLYPINRFEKIIYGARDAVNYVLRELAPNDRIVLMGHSSGAQMASLLALDQSLLNSTERIEAMIGLAGPYDFFPFTEDDHWDLFLPEAAYPRSQPVNYVRADGPELYLLHGAEDTRVRRGHSKSLMEKQRAVGGKASREVYAGMGHVDAVVSFSRIHRRQSQLIRDIQLFLESRNFVTQIKE